MKYLKKIKNIFQMAPTAMIINVFGLYIAFAAFLIIIMQTHFDSSFDSYHRDAKRIYRIALEIQGKKMAIASHPIAEFLRQSPVIEANALSDPTYRNGLIAIDQNETKTFFREKTRRISPSFTDVFHFEMCEGSDKALTQPGYVLIPESLAQKFFNNESALEKQIEISSVIATIGGVYKDFPENSTIQNEIYSSIPENEIGGWGQLQYNIYIKTIPNINKPLEELSELGNKLSEAIKINEPQMPATKFIFTPLRELHYITDIMYDTTPKSNRQNVFILLTIAITIILIAGINFMNFNIALLPSRIKAINIHKILGVSNRTIRLNYIFESIILSLLSFVFALFIVSLVSETFIASIVDTYVGLWANPRLIIIAFTVALIIGMLAGLLPAHYATSFRPALILKGSLGMITSAKTFRYMLIGMQFLIAYVLIISSWFMLEQHIFIQNAESGYNKEQVVLLDINNKIKQNKDVFTNRLKAVAGVEDVSYAAIILSNSDSPNAWNAHYGEKDIMFHWIPVDPSFLNTMNIKVEEGRDFREEDKKSRKGKYIFNEKARKEFGLSINSMVDSVEVIGFISDIQYTTFRTISSPMAFYVPSQLNSSDLTNFAYVRVAAKSDKKEVIQRIGEIQKQFETETPLQVQFYDDLFNVTYEKEKRQTAQISIFSILSVIISIMGVLGLVYFDNASRRKEIGIRKVLGSSEMEILSLFNKSYLKILITSFIIACPIAHYVVVKWMQNFAIHTPIYWWIFLISGLTVIFVTIVCVSLKSWKIAMINPLETLKN